MLSPESIVSPEAQEYLWRRKCCIMLVKDTAWKIYRTLIWDRLPKEYECESYVERELSQSQHDAIMDANLTPEQIEKILSSYY